MLSALEKGAQNVVDRCLAVQPGETLVVVSHKADHLADALERAARAAGAECTMVSASDLNAGGQTTAIMALDRAFAQGGPVVWLSEPGLPSWVAWTMKERANHHRCRHLHIPQADARVFEQSIRADPDELTVINARVTRVLAGANAITVTSPTGTQLEIRLDLRFPLVSLSGRPGPGETHWLPAGQVYTHPAQITGTFVADRSILISGAAKDCGVGRAHPARFELARGFVKSAKTDVAADQEMIDQYLASDPNARRVASIIVPTNYLVRTEIGHRGQDGLLPGMNINLGFADEATRAPYKTTVQMCLYARNLTIGADDQILVQAGRFSSLIVQGDEPFR